MKATRTIEVTLVLDEEEAEWLLAICEDRNRNDPMGKTLAMNTFSAGLKEALDHE